MEKPRASWFRYFDPGWFEWKWRVSFTDQTGHRQWIETSGDEDGAKVAEIAAKEMALQ